MASKNRSLKNILLAPHFQLKLLSYFLGLFFISTASFYSTTYLFFWKLKSKALSVGIPEEHVFFKFLSNQKEDMDSLFIGLVLFNFFLLLGVGFVVSHRIAGPLVKVKEKLLSLGPETDDLQLREKDFLQEIVPVVNDLKRRMKK